MRVNLIYRSNQAGLSQSAGIIDDVLTSAGATVQHSASGFWDTRKGRVVWRVARILPFHHDVNIFLEEVHPAWVPFARFNVLIPNQEWFEPGWLPELPLFDRVFCKTLEAERVFADVGTTVEYVGFTGRDMKLSEAIPQAEGVLHVAGRSLQKGTQALLRVWHRHPEWPTLTVIQRPQRPGHHVQQFPASNIEYITDFLTEETLQRLQNAISIHACPSEAEGYGQVLAESLSCGAILITTDAPPMNELVQPGRGLLASVVMSGPQRMGTCHIVSDSHLEARIQEALSMPPLVKEQIGRAAREWFLENDAAFRQRFPEAIARLLCS